MVLCSSAVRNPSTLESLVGCLKISSLPLQYLASELNKCSTVIWEQKQAVLRSESSACVLQTSTRNVKNFHTKVHKQGE